MTLQIPDDGPPFEAELVEGEFSMLWLHLTNSRGERMGVRGLLSVALTLGWRIVESTPEERALHESHELASGRVK